MDDRVQQELALLRRDFPGLEYNGNGRWVLFPRYQIEPDIWEQGEVAVCFQIPPGYPGQKPYGFHVSPPVQLKQGGEIRNRTSSTEPPFPGEWAKFSWDLPAWKPTADLQFGSNLLNFALSFRARFDQGA